MDYGSLKVYLDDGFSEPQIERAKIRLRAVNLRIASFGLNYPPFITFWAGKSPALFILSGVNFPANPL
jgi:hypothetical protein